MLTANRRQFSAIATVIVIGIILFILFVVIPSSKEEESNPTELFSATLKEPVAGDNIAIFRARDEFIVHDVYCSVEGEGKATIEFSTYNLDKPQMDLGSPVTCDKSGVIDPWDPSGPINPRNGAWVDGNLWLRFTERYGINVLAIEGNVEKIEAGFSFEGDPEKIQLGLTITEPEVE